MYLPEPFGPKEAEDGAFLLERSAKSVRLLCMKKWIVTDPEHLGGSPRVRGTRISVAFILESLAAGMSVAELVDAYPSLTEESVRGTLVNGAPEGIAAAANILWTSPASSKVRLA